MKDKGQETRDKGKKDKVQETGDKGREMPDEVLRYLEKYGVDKWGLEYGDVSDVKMVIVIPALMEYENIKKLLWSLAENDNLFFENTLVVFVVNNLVNAVDEVRRDNKCSLELLRGIIRGDNEIETGNKVVSSGLRIGLVDASSEGLELPEKDGGVGLARKIGMDLALKVFDYGMDGKNILVCLDGDCTVDKNYITEIYRNFQKRDLSAAAVNFRHTLKDPEEFSDEYSYAITCYEIFLRYYVLGLSFAGSPYAFHTIGSTMACDHLSYIKIEGMNKRKAAEDFYFMEKLAKTVSVEKINSTSVYPSPRGSWRVPFGTGQRVNRYLSHIQNEYLLYSPGSFNVLKDWLKIFFNSEANDPSYYLTHAENIHTSLPGFLREQNFERDYGRIILNSKKAGQLLRQKSGWFDGFRTLKLIHYLRDNGFPPEPMFDALDKIFDMMGIKFESGGRTASGEIPPLEIQLKYLELLRKIS